jgi:L-iditol 2-dehydrogenase
VDEKLQVMEKLGVDVTINAQTEDVVEMIMAQTDGLGADILIETAGSVHTHRQSLLAARKRARIIHIGRAYTDVLFPDEVFTQIFRKELTVFGAVNSNFSPHDHEWRTVLQYMSSGALHVKPLISHRIPLEGIAETFLKMFKKEMVYNKIIFSP